jgi:hypothetical protein
VLFGVLGLRGRDRDLVRARRLGLVRYRGAQFRATMDLNLATFSVAHTGLARSGGDCAMQCPKARR